MAVGLDLGFPRSPLYSTFDLSNLYKNYFVFLKKG